MTNTLFSAVGTKLLYLCPSGWIEPFYWDLAAMCGHDYGVFYGDSEPGLTSEPHRSDFSVPVDELLSTLDTLEGAG
jgi:hypothetical protein